ncbi:ABC transporter permease [Jiangella alkaliphila]|uniref:Ribose transport system permease protein n=1 Tax=Jiangella alkaliphila TaxID=419479 RepID=A0A1H2LDM4_9ACTN|nr:ABC transporter permease [Jiangella alkaliphila]SDU79019.1 ribose transport system permease protein [Jiangella alkaliphila]
MSSTEIAPPRTTTRPARLLSWTLGDTGIGLALIALVLIFIATAENFATSQNVSNILTQITLNTILATGMTFVILVAGIDLSVGSVLALSAMVGGVVITSGIADPLAILLALLAAVGVGMACGFVNGFVSVRWAVPSFIVTLGMLNIARGAALQTTDAASVFGFPDSFNSFGTATLLGLPAVFVVALVFVVLGHFVLTRTVFGRLLFAIGNNEESVRLAGHRTSYYKVAAFSICGAMAGLAAVIYMTRLHTSSPIIGQGYELNAIAAVVIGGTSLFGGKGSMIGTFLGACLLGVLTNGLLLLGVGDFARQMVTGAVIVLAVIIDYYRQKVSAKLTLSSLD